MTTTTDNSDQRADYFDFDAWHAEHHGGTIPFKVLGQVWEIPRDCPAGLLLKMQRLEVWSKQLALEGALAELEGRDPVEVPLPPGLTPEDVTGFTIDGIVRSFVGDEIADQWNALGIPHEMLKAVSKRLYAIYSAGDPDAAIGLPGKAPAPKMPKDRAPKTGKRKNQA